MGTSINTYIKVKNNGNGVINIYRDETKSETNGITYSGYGMTASKYNDDKSMMYIDAYGGWIEASNVTVVSSKSPSEPVDTGITIVPQTISNLNIVDPGSQPEEKEADATTMNSIIGMPYQFMDRVDRRADSGSLVGFGRKYRNKILSRDNFVYLTPGKQVFMPGADEGTKGAVLNALTDLATGSTDSILNASGRYYGLEPALDDYYKYVNAACQSVATLMGIGNERVQIGGHSNILRRFNWMRAKENSFLKNLLGSGSHIVVYPDGLNSISEDFGNSTRESSLVSQVNGYSDTIKEINYFMTGSADSAYANMLQNDGFDTALSGIQETVNQFTGGHGVLGALLGNSTTILSGGKLVFPELWSDSDYDRSYSIDIKLRTPDADDLSIYLNIIVPLIHLMALTAPRDFETNSNGYVAPFLVSAFCRSLFSIDLGIITSLNISKGGEGNWAASSNLPTSVDVSLSIKDLYKSMYMSKVSGLTSSGELAKFVGNDSEMEQLMNLAGVNITASSVAAKRLALYGNLADNKLTGIGSRIGNKLMNDLYTIERKIFGTR